MSELGDRLLRDALGLPREERKRLVAELTASLAGDPVAGTRPAPDIYIDELVVVFIRSILAAVGRPENGKLLLPPEAGDEAALKEAAMKRAAAQNRRYVTPQDVKECARELMIPRVHPQVASLEEGGASAVFDWVLNAVAVP